MVKNWINKQVKERAGPSRRFGREIRVETPLKEQANPCRMPRLAYPLSWRVLIIVS